MKTWLANFSKTNPVEKIVKRTHKKNMKTWPANFSRSNPVGKPIHETHPWQKALAHTRKDEICQTNVHRDCNVCVLSLHRLLQNVESFVLYRTVGSIL